MQEEGERGLRRGGEEEGRETENHARECVELMLGLAWSIIAFFNFSSRSLSRGYHV